MIDKDILKKEDEKRMDNELIILKQLPVIEEHLQSIGAMAKKKIDYAFSLPINMDTIKEIKKLRAELNKEFEDLENRRKSVKKQVMAEYDRFNEIYKKCVINIYKPADEELRRGINDLEGKVKAYKSSEIRKYFNEYAQSVDIDFLDFDRCGFNITLSASVVALKKSAKEYVDGIKNDLEVIEQQPNSDEVLYEYKKTLQLAQAVCTVAERHKALGEARKHKHGESCETSGKPSPTGEAINGQSGNGEGAVEKTENDNGALAAPVPVEADKAAILTFTVRHRISKLKELKEYLIQGGFEIL